MEQISKEEEEKARVDLQKEGEKEDEKNITEGNLNINDPVEIKPELEIELLSSEIVLEDKTDTNNYYAQTVQTVEENNIIPKNKEKT